MLLAFINLSGPIRKRQEFPELINFIVFTSTVALQQSSPKPVCSVGLGAGHETRLAMRSA